MYARIVAVHVEACQPQQDTIVIVMQIDDNNCWAGSQCYGYVWDNDALYPFVAEQENSAIALNFGAFNNGEQAKLNLVGKSIGVGELFTRADTFPKKQGVYSYTYRIESVFPMCDAPIDSVE